MSKQEIHDTLRLSPSELESVLRSLDGVGQKAQENPKRAKWRWRLQPQRLVVTVLDAGGAKTHYIAAARNISAGGIGFLIGRFIYEGSPILVTVRGLDGKARGVQATVRRCRHIAGRLHEIGAQFSSEVNPRDFFVRYDEEAYLFNQECVEPSTLEGHLVIAASTELVQTAIARALDDTRIDIERVSKGTHALEVIRRRPNLVFAHEQLGDMTGAEFVARARADGLSIPIILLSDTIDQDARMACIGSGANEMLFLPAQRSLILRAVSDFLSRRDSAESEWRIDSELKTTFVREVTECAQGMALAIDNGTLQDLAELARSLRHKAAACGHGNLVMLCERLIERMALPDDAASATRAAKQVIDACEALALSISFDRRSDLSRSSTEAA